MLPYDTTHKPLARELRKNMTDAEQSLWKRLRRKQVLGVQVLSAKAIGGLHR